VNLGGTMKNEGKTVCNDPRCALMKRVEKAFDEAFELPAVEEIQKRIAKARLKGEDTDNMINDALKNDLNVIVDEHMVKAIDDIDVAKSLLVNLIIARKSRIKSEREMASNLLNMIKNSNGTIINVEVSSLNADVNKNALTARIDKSTFPFNEYLTLPEFLAKIKFEPETPELPSTHQCLEAVRYWCVENGYIYDTTVLRGVSETEPHRQQRVFTIKTKDGEDATA